MIILNIPLVGIWVKIATIPFKWLAPILLFLCVLGSYVVRNSFFDVWVMLAFGFIGFWAKGKGLPLAPFILGVILGPLVEVYFRQAATLGFSGIWQKPIALLVIAIAIGFVVFSAVSSRKVNQVKEEV